MAGALLVFGSALLYALAFPPFDAWPLIWVALTPLVYVLHGCRGPGTALLWGALWALAMTLLVGNCLVPAAELFYQRSPLTGWLLLAAAGLLTAVPQYAAFAAIYWFLARRWRAALPLVGAAAWAGSEWARTALPPGNPWAISGYAPADFLTVVQIADLGGVPAVSFVVAAVNLALVQVWLSRSGPAGSPRAGLVGALTVAVLVGAAVIYGALRLEDPQRPEEGSRGTMIAAIQPGGGPRLAPNPEAGRASLIRATALSSEAIRNAEPSVVFWPESALAFYPEDDALYRRSLPASMEAPVPEIVAGGPRLLASGGVANAVFTISPRGEIVSSYEKQILLPLGESFPIGLEGMIQRDLGGGPRSYVPGMNEELLETAAGQAGVAICNETMIPSLIRRRVRMGAEFLLNPTNDAWFPDAACPLGLLRIARLRAIEERRWLLRVSSTGPSAIIDPGGRLVRKTAPGESTWIGAHIEAERARTLYNRTGGSFGLLCLVAALVGAIPGRRTARTHARTGGSD